MSFSKVTIQIVTWNSSKYILDCLESIFNQTYRDFQILVVDNNSQDDTVSLIKKNYPQVTVFQNNKNFGFARANNQGIKLLNAPYVLLCNPDIMLNENWLDEMMKEVEKEDNKDVGSFGGKLLRMKYLNNDPIDVEKTDIVDSCGLKMYKNRHIVEIGAGEKGDKFQNRREVFGHSGSLVLYRRDALEDVMIKTKNNTSGEYFDEDFFVYKEDVDLAWRLQLLGWKSLFFPQAVAYHVRSMSGSEMTKNSDIINNRKDQSSFTKSSSYRNHFSLLLKNDIPSNFFRNFIKIFFYEIKKFLYILFLETASLKGLVEFIKLLPIMLRKRKLIFKKMKVDVKYMRKWIN